MSWGITDLLMIRTNSTNYYFAPTELVNQIYPEKRRNQVVQEADSGEVKILTLSDNTIEIVEFMIRNMRAADRTVGGNTIRGWNTLTGLISGASTMNYRANTVDIWLPGTSKISSADFTARYWGDTIPTLPVRQLSGINYVGDGGQVIRFRKEI